MTSGLYQHKHASIKKILGISAFYHDSAAALTVGGSIVSAGQEERFIRQKYTASFPENAIRYCLGEAGIGINDLDAVVFYEKPLLKFERLLQTYYALAPKGFTSFRKAVPAWLREKLFIKKMLRDGLGAIEPHEKPKVKLLFSEHHLSHAASAFFPSPFEKAAILTVDGVGEWCTASIGIGENGRIMMLREMAFPHSIGLLYSAFTYYLGFAVNSGEYKVMGLAPFGNPTGNRVNNMARMIRRELLDIKDDGSLWLNQNYFDYTTGLRMVHDRKWEALFGFGRREPGARLEQQHCDLALAIQLVTEEAVTKMAIEAKKITGAENLCMAGGVALNCVANGKLLRENIFKNIYVQPAAGDAGGALGAALAINHMYFDEPGGNRKIPDLMAGTYLGPDHSDTEIERMSKKVDAVYTRYTEYTDLITFIAAKIAEGNIVGWFQGRMEFGPRALGNRSILADARNPEMQKKLNLKIKFREEFRPFAPSVLAGDVSEYFDLHNASPYMGFVAQVRSDRRKKLPEDYYDRDLPDRLRYQRSDIPSVTHVDYSARIQTVHRESNPGFWELINEFKRQTGYGLLINTSFNLQGEPIVCSPLDAYRCFMSTEMNYLVIGNFVFCKTKQPEWRNQKSRDAEMCP